MTTSIVWNAIPSCEFLRADARFVPFPYSTFLWTTRGKKWSVRKRILRELTLLIVVAVELLLWEIFEQVQIAPAAKTRIR